MKEQQTTSIITRRADGVVVYACADRDLARLAFANLLELGKSRYSDSTYTITERSGHITEAANILEEAAINDAVLESYGGPFYVYNAEAGRAVFVDTSFIIARVVRDALTVLRQVPYVIVASAHDITRSDSEARAIAKILSVMGCDDEN